MELIGIICVITVIVILFVGLSLHFKEKSVKKNASLSKDDKLDRIYDVLNHIRWIGLGLAGLYYLNIYSTSLLMRFCITVLP